MEGLALGCMEGLGVGVVDTRIHIRLRLRPASRRAPWTLLRRRPLYAVLAPGVGLGRGCIQSTERNVAEKSRILKVALAMQFRSSETVFAV